MGCMWVNIAQVNNFLVQRWHREIKTTLYRLFSCKNMSVRPAQHWTSIFFFFCLRRIWTTLSKQYYNAMLSQYGSCNILWIIFFIKVVCQPWVNITQVKTICNIVQKTPDNNAQKKILFNVVLVFSGQHCTDQNPMQCCP